MIKCKKSEFDCQQMYGPEEYVGLSRLVCHDIVVGREIVVKNRKYLFLNELQVGW